MIAFPLRLGKKSEHLSSERTQTTCDLHNTDFKSIRRPHCMSKNVLPHASRHRCRLCLHPLRHSYITQTTHVSAIVQRVSLPTTRSSHIPLFLLGNVHLVQDWFTIYIYIYIQMQVVGSCIAPPTSCLYNFRGDTTHSFGFGFVTRESVLHVNLSVLQYNLHSYLAGPLHIQGDRSPVDRPIYL